MSEDGDYQILTPRPPRRRRTRREWAGAPWTLAIAYGLWAMLGAVGAHNFYLRRPLYGMGQVMACILGIGSISLELGMLGGLLLAGLSLSLAWDMLTIPKVLINYQR